MQAKCAQPACGDSATHHLKTFLHGCMRVTLSVTVLSNQELPGVERAQIWVWARPLNADSASAAGVRRVPLSSEASCLSFGKDASCTTLHCRSWAEPETSTCTPRVHFLIEVIKKAD